MWRDKTLRLGVIGVLVAALCCFTPLLIVLFAALGVSWAIGYADYVLLPMLAMFAGITIYALWKHSRKSAAGPTGTGCTCTHTVAKPPIGGELKHDNN